MNENVKRAAIPLSLVGLVAAGIVGYNTMSTPGHVQQCVDRETMQRVEESRCDNYSSSGSGVHVYGWWYTSGGRHVAIGQRVSSYGTYNRPSSGSIARPNSAQAGTARGGFGATGRSGTVSKGSGSGSGSGKSGTTGKGSGSGGSVGKGSGS